MRHLSAWLPLLVAGAISLGHSPAATPPDTLRVAFVGDVMLDRGVRQSIERHGVDALFAPEIDSLFRRCGRVVANLECPATGIRRPVHKRFIFRAEPEWLAGLRRHGVTHLNLANNHTMDQGREGLRDTRQQVLRHGMTPFGMDSTADAACRPLLLAESPRRVWVFTSLRVPSENWAYLPDRPSVCECTIDTLAVEHGRHVSGVEEEAVAVGIVGPLGVVVQKLGKEYVDEIGAAHGATGVSGSGFFDHRCGQDPDVVRRTIHVVGIHI